MHYSPIINHILTCYRGIRMACRKKILLPKNSLDKISPEIKTIETRLEELKKTKKELEEFFIPQHCKSVLSYS